MSADPAATDAARTLPIFPSVSAPSIAAGLPPSQNVSLTAPASVTQTVSAVAAANAVSTAAAACIRVARTATVSAASAQRGQTQDASTNPSEIISLVFAPQVQSASAVARPAHPIPVASGAPAPHPLAYSSSRVDEINAELEAILSDRKDSVGRSTCASTGPTASAAVSPVAPTTQAPEQQLRGWATEEGLSSTGYTASQVVAGTLQPSGYAGQRAMGPAQVGGEQVVVGHFCRHAIKILSRVMEGMPEKNAKEDELRRVIKELWTQWVKGIIARASLLDRVSDFVRNSTEAARTVNVTAEFRSWYQNQLQLQSRNAAARAKVASSAVQRVGRSLTDAETRANAIHAAAMAQASNSYPHAQAQAHQPHLAHQHKMRAIAAAAAAAAAGTSAASGIPQPPGCAISSANAASRPSYAVGIQPQPSRQAASSAQSHAAVAQLSVPRTVVSPQQAVVSATQTAPQQGKKPRSKASKKVLPSGAGSQTSAPTATANGVKSAGTPGGPGQGSASAPGPVKKAARKVDDELDIVRDIVDIEGEEDMLASQPGAESSSAVETSDFDAVMLLAGARLRQKLQGVCKRFGITEPVPVEVMEVMSLAVRERLVYMLEQLSDVAKARTGADLVEWQTRSVGLNMRDRMQQMRDQEQHSLDAEADIRRDRAAKDAAKRAETSIEAEKSAKEAAASADAKKKEEAIKEKQRIAQSTQRNALFKVMGKIGKKSRPKSESKGLSSVGSKGASSSSVAPPGTTDGKGGAGGTSDKAGSGGVVPDGRGSRDDGSNRVTAKDKGDPNSSPMEGVVFSGEGGGVSYGGSSARRPPLALRDCLHVMESETQTRKSSLLFAWYTRLDVGKPLRNK
jgi:Transcription initiation factor TFIID component TAF4 family